MDCVKQFKERRDARLKAKNGREDDQWITMSGTHVLIDDGGQVSKGPDKLKSVVKEGGGYKSKQERKYGSNEKFSKALNNGWKNKKTGLEKKAEDFHKAVDQWKDVDFPEDKSEAVSSEDYDKKRMEDRFNRIFHSLHDPDPEAETMEGDMARQGYKKNDLGQWNKESNKTYSYGSGDDRTASEKTGHKNRISGRSEESREKIRDNKEYGYGPGDESTGGSKINKSVASESKPYEEFPVSMRIGGRKYASPEDKKKARETVSRFMKEAKDGDVYEVGGGFGSSGGSRFQVTTSRGKLAIGWIDSDGRRAAKPVQMSRANVEKYIANGAKKVK